MEKIDFSRLYEFDYNLSNLFAIRQFWNENSVFKMTSPRRTSCLLCFSGCSAIYKFGSEELSVPRGSVLYIPEGATYETRFFCCDDALPATILIEFSLLYKNGEHFCAADKPCVLKQEAAAHITKIFNESAEIYSAAVVPTSAMKSLVYRLLSDLSYVERQQDIYLKGFSTIAKGIAHLENELKNQKSVCEIAKMCNVSESTFRRLFKEYTGKSPVEYRNERRIMLAKKLLNTGGMTALEVALETGFDDPAYFCRVFKKHTGVTAGEYLHSLER